jgi:hypothetical protein
MRLLDGEMPSEVEQSRLLDLAANALGFDQAMGAVALASQGVASLGFANVHAARVMPKTGSGKMPTEKLWHYNWVSGDFKRKNAGVGGILGGNLGGGC